MRKILLFSTACVIGFSASGQKKIEYEFPEEMSPQVQKAYIELCDKGRILYDLNCAKCHSSFKGRKEMIPDFTAEQLSGYAIRVSNGSHEMNLPEELVTPEELELISSFLLYKKKNKSSKKK